MSQDQSGSAAGGEASYEIEDNAQVKQSFTANRQAEPENAAIGLSHTN